MNHELVHVATIDQAAGADRAFRRLFGGKVSAGRRRSPRAILYFYLTAPRVAAPRWYHEGIAVFVETWMAGGAAAPRAPTTRWSSARWCGTSARFYDPLGLVSEGTKIDFQVEVNSYLYGTRFMS